MYPCTARVLIGAVKMGNWQHQYHWPSTSQFEPGAMFWANWWSPSSTRPSSAPWILTQRRWTSPFHWRNRVLTSDTDKLLKIIKRQEYNLQLEYLKWINMGEEERTCVCGYCGYVTWGHCICFGLELETGGSVMGRHRRSWFGECTDIVNIYFKFGFLFIIVILYWHWLIFCTGVDCGTCNL